MLGFRSEWSRGETLSPCQGDTLSTAAGRPSWLGAGRGRKTARITEFTEPRVTVGVTVDEVTSMGMTSGTRLPELPFSNVGWPRPQQRR